MRGGIPSTRVAILRALAAGPLTAAEVGQRVGRTRAAAAVTLSDCKSKGLVTHDGRSWALAEGVEVPEPIDEPGPQPRNALVSMSTRYEDDPAAQLFVAAYPDGAPLEAIAAAFGVSHQYVGQVEARAIRHLRQRLRLVGVDASDLVAATARRGHALASGGAW